MLPHHTPLSKYLFWLFLIIVAVYAYSTARDFLYGPRILIDAPTDGITVTTRLVDITGTVENVSVLRLEGGIIPVNEHGVFNERLLVTPGINTFLLSAEDTFGRTRTQEVTILYTPEVLTEATVDPLLSPIGGASADAPELIQ